MPRNFHVRCRNKFCEDDTWFDLREDGRYCPYCGRDYYDGAGGVAIQLSKEELEKNNMKFKNMKKVVIALVVILCMANGMIAQTYPDEIKGSNKKNDFFVSQDTLITGVDTSFTPNYAVLQVRNDSLCIEGGDCIVSLPSGISDLTIGFTENGNGYSIALYDQDGNFIDSETLAGQLRNVQIEANFDPSGTTRAIRFFITDENAQATTIDIDILNTYGLIIGGFFDNLTFGVDTTKLATQHDISNFETIDSIVWNDTSKKIEIYSNGTKVDDIELPVVTDLEVTNFGQNTRRFDLSRTTGYPNIIELVDIQDEDSSPTNEIQVLSKSGDNIVLTNGGGSVTDDDNPNSLFQSWDTAIYGSELQPIFSNVQTPTGLFGYGQWIGHSSNPDYGVQTMVSDSRFFFRNYEDGTFLPWKQSVTSTADEQNIPRIDFSGNLYNSSLSETSTGPVEINNDLEFNHGVESRIIMKNDGDRFAIFGNEMGIFGGSTPNLSFYSYGDREINFATNGTKRLFIDDANVKTSGDFNSEGNINAKSIISTDAALGFQTKMSSKFPYYGYAIEFPSNFTDAYTKTMGGMYKADNGYIGSYGFTGSSGQVDHFYLDVSDVGYTSSDFRLYSNGLRLGSLEGTGTRIMTASSIGDVRAISLGSTMSFSGDELNAIQSRYIGDAGDDEAYGVTIYQPDNYTQYGGNTTGILMGQNLTSMPTTGVKSIIGTGATVAGGINGDIVMQGRPNIGSVRFFTTAVEAMRVHYDGNIGIGTDSPLAKLHVNGEIRLEDRIGGTPTEGAYFDANGQLISGGMDIDSTNEIQDLSLSGTTLNISNGVGVNLSSLQDGNGYWNKSGNNLSYISGTVTIQEDLILFSDLSIDSGNNNMHIGEGAGNAGSAQVAIGSFALAASTGSTNVAIGADAMRSNSLGSNNIAIGSGALRFNTSGGDNVGIGLNALYQSGTSVKNTSIGVRSLTSNVGDQNTTIGFWTGFDLTTGSNNTLIGYFSGKDASPDLDGCVHIGNESGRYNAVDNTLYIDNSSTSSPLIYGEFDNNFVRINGDLAVTDQVNGNAVNLSAWDSSNKFTRVSLGSGLSLSSGTLSATGTSPWTISGSNINYTSGSVSIGTTSAAFDFNLDGSMWINNGVIIDGENSGGSTDMALTRQGVEMGYRYINPTVSVSGNTVTIGTATGATQSTAQFDIPEPTQHVGRATITNQASDGTTNWTNISLNTVSFETGDVDVNTSLERIIANSSGYYEITYQGLASGGTSIEGQIRIKRNNISLTEYVDQFSFNSEDEVDLDFTDVLFLSSGQYIGLEMRQLFTGATNDFTIEDLYITVKKL